MLVHPALMPTGLRLRTSRLRYGCGWGGLPGDQPRGSAARSIRTVGLPHARAQRLGALYSQRHRGAILSQSQDRDHAVGQVGGWWVLCTAACVMHRCPPMCTRSTPEIHTLTHACLCARPHTRSCMCTRDMHVHVRASFYTHAHTHARTLA